MKRSMLILSLLALWPLRADAQESVPTVELVDSPVELARPPAREAFAKGLVALHNFWYLEARESFRAAARADSGFALAYWGEAQTFHNPFGFSGSDLDSMRAAMRRLAPTPAARAARARSARERAYLAAMEELIGDGAGRARRSAYARSMRALVEAYPNDIEARAFYALSLWGVVPNLRADSALREESARAAEAVLDRDPRHPGGLHYLVHALDTPGTAERALYAARVYREVAAGASHALHMPSHIFIQLGMWDEVVSSNRRAFDASDEWVRGEGLSLARRDYHAMDFMIYGQLQKGQYSLVEEELREIARLADETESGTLRFYHATWAAEYVLETGRWRDEPLPRSGYDARPELLGMGLNAVRTGRLATALEALSTMRERMSAAVDEEGSTSIRATRWAVATAELDAAVALAEGRGEDAVRTLREALSWRDRLPPANETPDPIKPPEELLGEVLLSLERNGEALEAFQASLEHRRGRASSHLGLARAAARMGDVARARAHYRALVRQFHQADPDIEALAEARRFLVAHPDRTPPPPIPDRPREGS